MNLVRNRLRLFAAAACVGLVAGCGGGDINIEPTTVDNSVDNSTDGGGGDGGGTTNPCASYTTSGGQTVQGSYDETAGDCTYSPSFADAGNNIEVDLRIPALPDGGAHIFEGSLFIGVPCDSNACLTNNGITEGGDGPTLTIDAGATLAWRTNADFMIINRGSQIFAVGTETDPITFTSVSDVDGTVGPEDVQQWGGIVMNGFGITNACEYTGATRDALTLAGECHVRAEGAAGLDESFYGGDNDDDSSGRLEYVRVKHTGATVGSGDELNGITFGGVGRNTVVRNLEVYSTFDDGIEMFGGAVNFENFVAVYVRDDSIDIDEGWIGSLTNGLVIQAESIGNHCIESDGIGGFDGLTDVEIDAIVGQGLNSNSAISNLTCIISPSVTQGDFDPGAGWRLREGMFATITDSQVITSFAADGADSNYCLRLDNRSAQGALDGNIVLDNNLFACQEPDNGSDLGTESGGTASGTTASQWAAANGDNVFATITAQTDPTAAANTELVLLDGTPPIYSVDATTVVINSATPDFTATGDGVANGYVGGVSLIDVDWIQNWTYGILDGSRAQPLWFE